MVGNQDTPGINPDTPEYPDIPGINSGCSGFCRTVAHRVVSIGGVYTRLRFISKLQIILHTFSCHMYTCRRHHRRSRVQGDRRAIREAGASSAGEL